MTSTLVLVFGLTGFPLAYLVLLAACFRQARCNGQGLKSVSVSLHRGITAEFYPPSGGQSPHRTVGEATSERNAP
jgi:hypothetical protein